MSEVSLYAVEGSQGSLKSQDTCVPYRGPSCSRERTRAPFARGCDGRPGPQKEPGMASEAPLYKVCSR